MSGDIYKNRTRIRVNGLLIENDAILLAQIKSPVTDELIWMPPGGGLEFGESIHDCLRREFREETGFRVDVGSLVAVNELLRPPFHAIEMYFNVRKTGGTLRLGKDPEHDEDNQLLKDLQWVSLAELSKITVAPDRLPDWIDSESSEDARSTVFYQTN